MTRSVSSARSNQAEHRLQELRANGYIDVMDWVLDTAAEEDEATSPDEEVGAEEVSQEHLRGETVSAEEAKRLLRP